MSIVITLHGCDTACCGAITHKARGMSGPIGPLARKMIDSGAAKPFDTVSVYRGDTLCFHPRSLIHWASVHTTESFHSSAKTVVYKRRPDLEGAS